MLHMPSLQKALRRMQRGAALARRCGRQVKGRGFSPHNGIRMQLLTLGVHAHEGYSTLSVCLLPGFSGPLSGGLNFDQRACVVF